MLSYRNYKGDYSALMADAKKRALWIPRDTQGNLSLDPHTRLEITEQECSHCNGTAEYDEELKQMLEVVKNPKFLK